jgi:hypothetical protein
MLSDRRNCLRGLTRGFDDFLIWFVAGEPFREEAPAEIMAGRERGGPHAGTAGREADRS